MLVLRIWLGVLFVSAAWSKTMDWEKHVSMVKDYQLLPGKLLFSFARLEVIAEWLTGAFLFLGLFQSFAYSAALLLLCMYTTAITINLWRGRRELSCGCGGLAGNHLISWGLVLRNGVYILGCVLLLLFSSTWGSLDAAIGGNVGLYAVADDIFHLFVPFAGAVSQSVSSGRKAGSLLYPTRRAEGSRVSRKGSAWHYRSTSFWRGAGNIALVCTGYLQQVQGDYRKTGSTEKAIPSASYHCHRRQCEW